jgi:hypothetical protein
MLHSISGLSAVMLWTMQLVYCSQYHVSHTQLQNTYDHFLVVATLALARDQGKGVTRLWAYK